MKLLLQTALVLALVSFAAVVSAKPPGGEPPGNIIADVAALQDENEQQQLQIDNNEADIVTLYAADIQLQHQIDDNEERILSNDQDIAELGDADDQLQNQIDDNEERILQNEAAIASLSPGTSPVIDLLDVTVGGSSEYCSGTTANNPWGCYQTIYQYPDYVFHIYGENLGDNPTVYLEQTDSGEIVVGAVSVISSEHISVPVQIPSWPNVSKRVRSLHVITDYGEAIVLNAFKVET